jgi:hypothetical protein
MTLNDAIKTAKSKVANNPAWLRSVEKAGAKLASGELFVTLLAGHALVTSEGGTYIVTKGCTCPAHASYCYHRSAVRLVEMMSETEAAPAPSPADEVRAALRAAWNRKYASNRRYNLDHTMASICGRDVESAPLHYLQQLLRALPMAEV